MRAVAIQSRYAERDCRSIVNQQVNSIKKDVVLRTSYIGHQLLISTQPARGAIVELEPAWHEGFSSLMQQRKTSSARTVQPEMRLCPGSRFRKII